MKYCPGCKCEHSISKFGKHRRNKDGLQSYCKTYSNKMHSEWVSRNKEKESRRVLKWRAANKDKCSVSYKKWHASPKGKIFTKLWSRKNAHKLNAKNAKRRAAKLHRIPKWLTKSDWIEINWAYAIAKQMTKETGELHHVDHIIPLLGKNISGLHCPQNLKVILAKENLQKGNRY